MNPVLLNWGVEPPLVFGALLANRFLEDFLAVAALMALKTPHQARAVRKAWKDV